MMILRKPQLEDELRSDITARSLWRREIRPHLQEKSSELFSPIEGLSTDQLLLRSTKIICEKYRIHFAHLSTIQRKFVTHYRCSQCGLLPLYHLDLLHIKRVRCRKCGQLIAFKKKGKYGKLRKEIAFEFMKENRGDVILAEQ